MIRPQLLFQYGFIALPVAFAGFPLYVLVPDFYATHYGLSLTLLGVIFLAIRLFDAVQDPLIGWLADKFQSRLLLFMIAAASILCLSIFGLFNITFLDPATWLVLCMTFAVTAYSVLTIILGVRATLWTSDEHDQTRIAGTREMFGLIGLLVAVSIPPALAQFIDPDGVYIWYTLILSSLMLCGIMAFSRLPRIVSDPHQNSFSPLSGLRLIPKETRIFLAVYCLNMLASSIPAVLVIFFVRDLLGAEHLTGLFLLLYFLSGAVGMPFWRMVSSRIGKYKTWGISSSLAVTGFIGAFLLGNGDAMAYGIICIATGLALGADLTLPPSILADHVHKYKNTAHSGTHYALLAFVGKASLAIASAIALPALDLAGFKPQSVNSEQALFILSASYALIPCMIKIISTAMLYKAFIRPQSGGHHEFF